MKLIEKINNARADMSLAKNQKNNFGGFSFRSIEDIWERLVPVCEKHKITYSITKEEADVKGNFLVFHFEAEFKDCESDETLTTTMDVPMTSFEKKGMDSNQVFGSFLSYNRKYIVCRDFQIRAGLSELDSDEEINTVFTKIEQCQTIDEVLALKSMIEKIKEPQNKEKASKLANEKYKEIKAQPSLNGKDTNNTNNNNK